MIKTSAKIGVLLASALSLAACTTPGEENRADTYTASLPRCETYLSTIFFGKLAIGRILISSSVHIHDTLTTS